MVVGVELLLVVVVDVELAMVAVVDVDFVLVVVDVELAMVVVVVDGLVLVVVVGIVVVVFISKAIPVGRFNWSAPEPLPPVPATVVQFPRTLAEHNWTL